MSARDPGSPGWFAAGGGILPEVVERAQRFQADLTRRDVVFDLLGLPRSHIPHLPLEQLREEVIREGGRSAGPGTGHGGARAPGMPVRGGRHGRDGPRRNAMLVEKRMKRDPVTVAPDDSFRHAMTLIRQKGIRHLPVVEGGRLVGIVTDRDIRQTSPSPATSLEIHELHYLLERVTVREIMTKKVITVTADTPIEEAARVMLAHKIGGLPVVKDGTLVGIITETDILRAFVEVMGIQQEQTRLELVLEDRPGAFLEVCRIIQEQGGDIVSVVTATAAHHGEQTKVLIFRLEGVQVEPLVTQLKADGHTVLSATT
jgi:acetoin utilization protein AcuB